MGTFWKLLEVKFQDRTFGEERGSFAALVLTCFCAVELVAPIHRGNEDVRAFSLRLCQHVIAAGLETAGGTRLGE